MAAKRTYKRDSKGRFATTGQSRAKRVGKKINRQRPRYVRGSAGKTVRLGRVGPGREYYGVSAGVKVSSRKRGAEYYVGVTAGRRIPSSF